MVSFCSPPLRASIELGRPRCDSLIFSWQHFTRTLAAVEPITAAISEADPPWLASRRISLITAGVKTRRRDPFGSTRPKADCELLIATLAQVPTISRFVVMAMDLGPCCDGRLAIR